MKPYNLTSLILLLAFLSAFIQVLNAQPLIISKSYEFKNGQWFDGEEFVSKTMYCKDGYFTNAKPLAIDSVVDLLNKFVVPPFRDTV